MSEDITFAQFILEKLGIEDLPEELQADFVADIGTLIMQAVLVRAAEIMPEDKLDALMAITNDETKGPSDLFDYLKENMPNAEEVIREEGERILANWEEEADF